jgi:hypothetical protein
MNVAFDDPGLHQVHFSIVGKITRSSPTVVLTRDSFFFGDLEAFTEKFSDVRNKFYIPHVDGRPDIDRLIDTMARWMKTRENEKHPISRDVAVFLPSGEIPLPIVIQVFHWLKNSKLFGNAVLGSDLK